MTTPSSLAAPTGTKPIVRLLVRPKDGWLTATPVLEGTLVRRQNGTLVSAREGQYLLQLDGHTIDVCDAAALSRDYDVREAAGGGLSLTAAQCRLLEDRLGPGCTQTPERLLAAIARLAVLRIGDVAIPVTPGQWEEIAYRAQKNDRTVEAEITRIAERLEDELFHGGVGRGIGGRI